MKLYVYAENKEIDVIELGSIKVSDLEMLLNAYHNIYGELTLNYE